MDEPWVPGALPGDIDCRLWLWLYLLSVPGREREPYAPRVVASF
jgi:hypothetical protein